MACSAGVAEGTPEDFRALLEDASVTKAGADLKTQMKALAERGITLAGPLEDIELMHYLLGPERSHKTDVLARAYLGIELETAPPAGDSLFDALPDGEGPDRVLETAALLRLSDCLRREMAGTEGMERLYDEIEEPLIGVLARMERTGVKVDLDSLRDFADGLRRKMAEREAEVRRLADDPSLNILSPKQVGVLLFEKMQLDPKARKPKSGNWPTDEQTLSHLADRSPIIDAILDYRGLRKLLSTYIEPFAGYISPEDGRVHTTFNQALTATGRLSSSNPNLQNIPIRTEEGREIRKAFVAGEPGWVMMSADYSQIELRLMAHLCGDAHLLDAFRHGVDVHAATAAKIFRVPLAEVTADQRRIAKTANFGIMYGISSFGLAERLRCSALRSEADHRRLFRLLPLHPRLHRRHRGAGARTGVCGDPLRPPPLHRRHQRRQRRPPRPGGAQRRQRPHPGHGGGYHQAGDDRRGPAPARRRFPLPDGPPDPRRTAARSPAGRDRARARTAGPRDGKRHHPVRTPDRRMP